jgi:predicted AAA+ superfamily ATPase
LLENIVALELLRRGYTPRIGRVGTAEVDFVAERHGERLYLQIAYLLADPAVIAREFGPLKAISDNYRKVVLSMDRPGGRTVDGIEWRNLPQFLLDPSW